MSKLTGPQLGIKTYRADPNNWLFQNLTDTSRVLAVAMEGDTFRMASTHLESTDWKYLEPGSLAIDAPDASYDAVYLTNVLVMYPQDKQKLLIAEAARVTKNNGRVYAFHPACDDSQEILDLAESYGLPIKDFISRRMDNRSIARLRPHDAAFFLGKLVIPTKERLVTVMNSMGLAATLEHMWTVKEKFAIKRFHVGMSWTVLRG